MIRVRHSLAHSLVSLAPCDFVVQLVAVPNCYLGGTGWNPVDVWFFFLRLLFWDYFNSRSPASITSLLVKSFILLCKFCPFIPDSFSTIEITRIFLQGHASAFHCDGLVEVVGLQGVMHLVSQNHHHLYPSHHLTSAGIFTILFSPICSTYFFLFTTCHNFCILPFHSFLSICIGNVLFSNKNGALVLNWDEFFIKRVKFKVESGLVFG